MKEDEIAKLDAIVKKVLAYGPPRKNMDKQKQRIKKAKSRKKQAAHA
jgi:hypothetical protein